MHVRRTIQRVKNAKGDGGSKTQLTFLSPMNASSLRSIPLPRFLIMILTEHQQQSGGQYVISREDYKLGGPGSRQLGSDQLLAAAGIRPVAFQAMRHTFAVRALESGFDVMSLSEILGHASLLVTYKKYVHVLDGRKRRGMEMLAGRVGGDAVGRD
jgi:integrase